MPEQERDRQPIGLNVALGTAAFMTAWDRTKTLKGGLAGAALAGSFMLARKYLNPRDEDARAITNTVWNAVEFSAITSLLGSSMMRGGFLHRAVGRPTQRAAATTGFQKIIGGLGSLGGLESVKEYKSVHQVVRKFQSFEHQAAQMLQKAMGFKKGIARETAKVGGPLGFLAGQAGKMVGWAAEAGASGFHRVAKRYSGIAKDYLRGVAIGPRGPFEVTSGLFDVSKKLTEVVASPTVEAREAVKAFLKPGSIFSKGLSKPLSKAFLKTELGAGYLKATSEVGKSIYFRAARVITRYRKYFEGIFGSPTVGELVQKYGSIKNIPLQQYAGANMADVFYGAAPGLLLASPVLAYQGVKYGAKKGYNKIVGHHPGWANKQTEEAIDSDFTAGQSWTHIKNALVMFVKHRRRYMVSGALAATLAASPTSVALAKDIGVKAARAVQIHTVASAATRSQRWRDVVDTVVKTIDKDPLVRKRAAKLIYETGVHESGLLKHVKQVGGGPARGLVQMEPKTAFDIIQNYGRYRKPVMDVLNKTTGIAREDFLRLNPKDLSRILEKNQVFATAMARFKYKRVKGAIPGSLEDRAAYWAKNFWAGKTEGKTKAQIRAMRAEKSAQFIKHNRQFREQAQTVGFTNKAMYEKRTQHQVMDVVEKTKHLFNTK